MKSVKLAFIFLAIATSTAFLSCSKSNEEDEGADCEDNNTTIVTFSNTGTTPLRVTLARTLTPQFVPIDPIFSIDLAPGQSVEREFQADQYFNLWYRDCPSNCSMTTYYYKTYESCSEYQESRGI